MSDDTTTVKLDDVSAWMTCLQAAASLGSNTTTGVSTEQRRAKASSSGSMDSQRCHSRSRSFPNGKAGTHSAGSLVGEPDDSVRVGLEVEPPGGMPFVPTVHGEPGHVWPVLQVGDDDLPRSLPDVRPIVVRCIAPHHVFAGLGSTRNRPRLSRYSARWQRPTTHTKTEARGRLRRSGGGVGHRDALLPAVVVIPQPPDERAALGALASGRHSRRTEAARDHPDR